MSDNVVSNNALNIEKKLDEINEKLNVFLKCNTGDRGRGPCGMGMANRFGRGMGRGKGKGLGRACGFGGGGAVNLNTGVAEC